jgi:replicative DNA helicase
MFDDLSFDDDQWLIDNGLADIADPSKLYTKIVERRERGDDGIEAPVSKLQGQFSLPRRGITLFGAYSGTGKSTFASQWAVHAANQGHKVAIMSLEMPSDFTLELMAEQAAVVKEPHLPYIERFATWADGRVYLYDSTAVTSEESVFKFVETAVTLLGCSMVVIDPLMQITLGTTDNPIAAEQAFITRLASLSRDLEVAILLVHHLRKAPAGGQGEKAKPDKASFLGSTHLSGASAAVCTLWADPDKREARSNGSEVDDSVGGDYVFTVHKQRFAPWHGSVHLYQHSNARVICNSKARQYRPIILEDECKNSKSEQSIWSQEAAPLSGSQVSWGQETTPMTATKTQTAPFPS